EAFLRLGLARGASAAAILDPPDLRLADTSASTSVVESLSRFTNEPHADFALAGVRQRFAAALAAVREQFGREYPLVIGGAAVETSERLLSRNPSRPDEVVGRAASASAEDVDRAVAAAQEAFPGWRDRGAAERARVLERAEQTPVIAAKPMGLLAEAGLPPGVLNYVPGAGEIAGDRLVHHPGVRLIAFTGSRDVGTQIYAAAAHLVKGARHLKRVLA